METAVKYLEEAIKVSNKDTFNDLVECIEVAKQMEHKQIEKAIENGYAGCCGKKTTVRLKGNFWEREEKWDERKSANAIIVNSKKKP